MINTDPPRDLAAEEAVLSSILIDNAMIAEVIPVLGAKDFYRAENQVLYASACRLWSGGRGVDPYTLVDDARANGDPVSVDYIASLIGLVPSVANVKSYAEIVSEKAQRRRIMKTSLLVADSAAGSGDMASVMADADLLLTELAGASVGGFDLMKKSVWPAMERIDHIIAGDAEHRGILTGFVDLDRMLVGFEPGDLIVMAGRPSMGKTALALNITTNLALSGDTPVAIVSLEMTAEALTGRCIAAEARVDMHAIRNGTFSPEASTRLATAAGHLDNAMIYVDDHPQATVPEIAAKLDHVVRGRGVKLVVVDYLQLMRGRGDNRVNEVSDITRSLKLMAGKLGVPVLVLSQLSRAVEARQDKRPMLSDLRDSGSIEQDADVVMFVYRPEYYVRPDEVGDLRGLAEVIVSKQRNGPTGSVSMHFTKEYARFDNLDRGHVGPRA